MPTFLLLKTSVYAYYTRRSVELTLQKNGDEKEEKFFYFFEVSR